MLGCSEDDPDLLRTPNDLIYLVHRIGLLPLFSNAISGFSVEGHTLAKNWWTGDATSDPWEWMYILTRSDELTYGKIFRLCVWEEGANNRDFCWISERFWEQNLQYTL